MEVGIIKGVVDTAAQFESWASRKAANSLSRRRRRHLYLRYPFIYFEFDNLREKQLITQDYSSEG